ncbi:hypothetical protein N8T08_003364 [Aspergillus melleus]|uniref:Uncharacterized protein n=1 Tax=Aspergillus melleus TaxID=138277 RepID=A0ACC3BGD1_9EURO|nr:hypothetical protein N8T08_003364 [Aspergillus melleus]
MPSGFAGLNLQRPAFQPLLFVPAAQQNEMMGQVVRWVDAACHERLPQGGNHWSLYLIIGENFSVRIDITPSYVVPSASIPGGSKANMIVSLLEDAFSRPTEKVVKLDVPDDSTVRELVNLLIQHGRHKYEFNGQGQGCRYWTDHQIDLFYQHGLLVDCAQIEAAKEAILTQWPDQMRYPLVQGGYYQ